MKKIVIGTLLVAGLLVSVVQTQSVDTPLITTLDFTKFDTMQDSLGLRQGKSKKLSLDAEPEYIAITSNNRTAYVSLQESNALATIDLATAQITSLKNLGFKDHSKTGNGIDASDRDGNKINIQNYPVLGAYMPDAIATINIAGGTFLLTANEGDSRDYGAAFLDESRVSSLTLDPTVFPNAAALKTEAALGRLIVSNVDADTDGDKDADRLVAFGARSVGLWDARGNLVADTSDMFERKTAELFPSSFNGNGTNSTFDTRSDNKGPEPEGVTTGVVDGKTFVFVGLERAGGIMVLDASLLRFKFVDYAHFVTPAANPNSGTAGDLAPEGLIFISAAQSPNGQALVVASHEVSGSVTLYSVANTGKLTRAGRYQAEPFAFDKGVAEISAYDPNSKQLFVVNGNTGGLDVLSIADVSKPTLVKSISLAKYGRAANSVAVNNGIVAVAVEAVVKTAAGKVALLNTDGTERAPAVTVGALPDMLTFTPNGQFIMVANEGEPNADYTVDPAGSVSIINVTKALSQR
jgi:hypothetical protein